MPYFLFPFPVKHPSLPHRRVLNLDHQDFQSQLCKNWALRVAQTSLCPPMLTFQNPDFQVNLSHVKDNQHQGRIETAFHTPSGIPVKFLPLGFMLNNPNQCNPPPHQTQMWSPKTFNTPLHQTDCHHAFKLTVVRDLCPYQDNQLRSCECMLGAARLYFCSEVTLLKTLNS